MADDSSKTKGPAGDVFKNCVVDHHRLLSNEEYTDVTFFIDDKAALHAHYNILKRMFSMLCFWATSPLALPRKFARWASVGSFESLP